MILEFHEDTHTYIYNGEEVPSVSEILRFARNEIYSPSTRNKAALDKAADRGSRIHRAAEEIDREGVADCDADILPYVEGYVKFLKEHDVRWEMIEVPLLHLGPNPYAGRLDRYGTVDGKKMLVDIKSTKVISKQAKILYDAQLTAYSEADYFQISEDVMDVRTLDVQEMAVLQLKDDGTYKLVPAEDEEVWWHCLRLHHRLSKTKRKKVSK